MSRHLSSALCGEGFSMGSPSPYSVVRAGIICFCSLYSAGLDSLRFEWRRSKAAAFAPGSKSNIRSQSKAFFIFCKYYEIQALPISTEYICLYAQFLARSFKTVDAIKAYLQAVKHLHQLVGADLSGLENPQLGLTLKGIARLINVPPTQAYPLTPQILAEIHDLLSFDSPLDLVFWSVLLTGFYSLARISNLVKTNKNNFQLSRKQVFLGKNLMLLIFTKTKTIQFGQRALKIPLVAQPDSILCPVRAYKRMLEDIPAPKDSSAFVIPVNRRLTDFTYSRFQKRLKSLITLTGRNPRLYSSHSMRRGGATTAFMAGVPTKVIQTQGDWATDSYLRYIKLPASERL